MSAMRPEDWYRNPGLLGKLLQEGYTPRVPRGTFTRRLRKDRVFMASYAFKTYEVTP